MKRWLATPGWRQATSAKRTTGVTAGALRVKQTAHSGQTGNGRTRAVRGWPVSPPIPPPRVAWWRECGGLLASGPRSPSRFPSGGAERGDHARYSGGAAPDLHRLPRICVRVGSILMPPDYTRHRGSRASRVRSSLAFGKCRSPSPPPSFSRPSATASPRRSSDWPRGTWGCRAPSPRGRSGPGAASARRSRC